MTALAAATAVIALSSTPADAATDHQTLAYQNNHSTAPTTTTITASSSEPTATTPMQMSARLGSSLIMSMPPDRNSPRLMCTFAGWADMGVAWDKPEPVTVIS